MVQTLQVATPFEGRTADLLALQSNDPYTLSLAKQSVFTSPTNGRVVSGSYKVLQNVVIKLFSPQRLNPADPGSYSPLALALLRGGLQSEQTIRREFARSRDVLLRYFEATTTSRQPSEILSDIALLDVTILGNEISMSVRVTTAIGASAAIVLPVKLND